MNPKIFFEVFYFVFGGFKIIAYFCDMKTLSSLLKSKWSSFIIEFNQHIQNNFQITYLETFAEFTKDKTTQEVTKIISPIFNKFLSKYFKNYGFIIDEQNGKDYVWEGTDIEGKLSLSSDGNWTGNGFKKTNWHLLIKIKFNELGVIDSSHVCLIPLDECVSEWSKSGKNDNFSSLKIKTEDFDKVNIIFGDFKVNRLYLKPIFL